MLIEMVSKDLIIVLLIKHLQLTKLKKEMNNMKKYKLIIPLTFSIPFSSIAISCKYEDYEKLEKDEQDDSPTNKLDFNPISSEGKNIKQIYDNDLTKLFIETKENYLNYRVI